jgi:plasmid stabilization system protein ParE
MTEVLVSEGAQQDLTESLRWYAERSRQAAEGFESEYALALQDIGEHPERYPRCDDVINSIF